MSVSVPPLGYTGNTQNIRRRLGILAVFEAAWVIHRFATSRRPDEDIPDVALAIQTSVVPDVIKLALAIGYYFWQRWRRRHLELSRGAYHDEILPLNGVSGDRSQTSFTDDEEVRAKLPSQHSASRIPPSIALACGVFAAVLFMISKRNLVLAQELTESISVWLATSLSTLVIELLSYAFLSRNLTLLRSQAIMLQFSGFCTVQSMIIAKVMPPSAYLTLSSVILSTSFYISFMDYIYTSIHSISIATTHVVIFASSLMIHGVVLSRSPVPQPLHELALHLSSARVLFASASQALMDLTLLATIYFQDGTTAVVFQSFSAAMYLLGLGLIHHVRAWGFIIGACLAIVGAVVYIAIGSQDLSAKATRSLSARFVMLLVLAGAAVWLGIETHAVTKGRLEVSQATERPSVLDLIEEATVSCPRRPLASASYYRGKRTYHAFDDVLLVVFFSHARYDANLDYYREVYSEFFPNIVYVGPGSRQDSGFAHSYDVLVDSYEADEDLSDPTFYKMAGRMAHHMLYTALREYPCYEGYLWAPFDTLLNVPRLQQFDQRYFWYHSPFGQYVNNPALGDEAANQNISRHAPPANISPDPSVNLTATFRHWGVDWWWGEPHVGVDVCMPAFNKAPAAMREHLASLTNGTRLIGGSADTMYIPGRHRESFMDVLGAFLETDCFLEIATPTTLHLVSPPVDPILYVDHWWIWQPPFNATFVRQKWAEGMEVDTFHTFHWGDKDENGIWMGNPEHIPDVRRLLAESARRQGIPWTSRTHTDPIWS